MIRKKVIYTKPNVGQEEFVRHIFSIYAQDLGFVITNIQKAFPDCEAIDTRNNRNKRVYIELEYEVGNFFKHGHVSQMEDNKEYIVVCWSSKGIDLIPENIEVIVLSDKQYGFKLEDYELEGEIDSERPLYRIIGYNQKVAYGKTFDVFENAKIFRTNIWFKDNYLPKGSVIVLYEKGKLIGEFTVISYHWIDRAPKTEYEKSIYRLISYPVTVAEDVLSDPGFTKGHIVFTNFKKYDPPVRFDILNRNMSRGGSLNLTFDEIELIRGRIK